MQKLQDVFSRMQTTKQEQKQIKAAYKDALEASREYKETLEKLRGYKLRKKQIEDETKASLGTQYDKLETLKADLNMDKELLADIAISSLMKGETVEVKDSDGVTYEPVFSVKFKKTNVVEQERQ